LGVDYAEARPEKHCSIAETGMKARIVIFLVAFVCWTAQAKEQPPETMIFRTRIEYPLKARVAKMEGAGVYVLDVDNRGLVTAAHVAISSGHKLLDQAAIDAMLKFRFKPGGNARVKIPARWKLSDRTM
jgi:TonB family protein